jgi:hypothetical protein
MKLFEHIIEHKEEILAEGTNNKCTHRFISEPLAISITEMNIKQDRICVDCGKFIRVITQLVKYNPFTFSAIKEKFHGRLFD